MAIEPTSPPSVSDLPPAPNSATDTPSEFDTKANNTVAAQVSMIPQINAANEWVESTAQEVYENAVEANDRAVDSENSSVSSAIFAANSAASANYVGVWSELSGALDRPASVQHNDSYWILNVDLPDVTASEPTPLNSDWSVLAGYRWKIINASGNSTPNSYELCEADAADITRALPTFGAGDFLVFNNSSESGFNVILPAVGVTIYGKSGVINAGDNLVLQAGDTAHIAAETSTILRLV